MSTGKDSRFFTTENMLMFPALCLTGPHSGSMLLPNCPRTNHSKVPISVPLCPALSSRLTFTPPCHHSKSRSTATSSEMSSLINCMGSNALPIFMALCASGVSQWDASVSYTVCTSPPAPGCCFWRQRLCYASTVSPCFTHKHNTEGRMAVNSTSSPSVS